MKNKRTMQEVIKNKPRPKSYRIKIEREYCENWYSCGKCKREITTFIRKRLEKIMLAIMKGKQNIYSCPSCRSKINWKGIGNRFTIVPNIPKNKYL